MADNLPGHGDAHIAPDGSEDATRPQALEAYPNPQRRTGANQMLITTQNDHVKPGYERSGDIQSKDGRQAQSPATTGSEEQWRIAAQPRRVLEQEAQQYASMMREWKARSPGPWPLGVKPYDVLIEMMRSPAGSGTLHHRTVRLFSQAITKTRSSNGIRKMRREPPGSTQEGWKTHPATFPAPEVIIATNILLMGSPWTLSTIDFLEDVGAAWMIDPTEKRTAWWAGFDLWRPTVAMKAIFLYTSNPIANTPPITAAKLDSFLAGASSALQSAAGQENHDGNKTAQTETARHKAATDKPGASANPGTSSSARVKRTANKAHEDQPSSKKQATAPGFRHLDWKEFQLFSISHGKAYFLDADSVSRVGRDITFAGGVMLATVDHEGGSRLTPIKDVRGEEDAWLNEMGIWNIGQGHYKIGTVKEEEEEEL